MKLIKETKAEYYKGEIATNTSKPRDTWRQKINEVTGRNKKNQRVMKLIYKNQDITKPLRHRRCFERTFQLADENNGPDQGNSDFVKYLPSCSTSFSLSCTTAEIVRNLKH